MKRNDHWPYDEASNDVSKMDMQTIKITAAIILTVFLSLCLGMMFARGI